MDKENYWTKFCKDANQSMVTLKDDFKETEMAFVDKASEGEFKQDSDEESLESLKNDVLGFVDDSKKNELSLKMDKLLECIRERDKKIEDLKKDTDANKKELDDWYKKAKHDCEELCEKLGKYTNEESGVLNIVAYILEDVVSKEGLIMGKAITKVKDVISSRERSANKGVAGIAFLILIALMVMAILFVMIGTDKVLFDTNPTNLGKWIAGGFILAFSVGAVFLIIRICSLIKKSKNEIRQLQLLLDKMEIHKMTKHEIDRELERIQETVEK